MKFIPWSSLIFGLWMGITMGVAGVKMHSLLFWLLLVGGAVFFEILRNKE
jgi:hypothetical protein